MAIKYISKMLATVATGLSLLGGCSDSPLKEQLESYVSAAKNACENSPGMYRKDPAFEENRAAAERLVELAGCDLRDLEFNCDYIGSWSGNVFGSKTPDIDNCSNE
jgi:hypothetical protein